MPAACLTRGQLDATHPQSVFLIRHGEPSACTGVSALGADEQRMNVRLTLVDPPGDLSDGFRVEARMIVWEGREALTVPASALLRRAVDERINEEEP
jgi:hypothetical protein